MTSSSSKITTSSLDSAWTPPYTSASEVSPGEASQAAGDLSLGQPICFRICGIPSEWKRRNLNEALQRIYPKLGPQNTQLSTLFPACYECSQTALLTVYRRLERYILPGLDEEIYHPSPETGGGTGTPFTLRFDKHFYDLTPLNVPEGPVCADLIAITGLSGHAFGSWRSRVHIAGSLDRPMWLRDFLPKRFPQTRIMTYGYDSSLSNPNGCNFLDYARSFEQCILNARRDCPKRTIIFIAHSLGGLFVNELLLKWAQSKESEPIFGCIRGVFFFGTPHSGLRTKELSDMVNKGGVRDKKTNILLTQLAENSEFLENQKDYLSRMWGKFKGDIFTFYETEKTKAVKEVALGVWDRSGELFQMVQRSSAQLFLPNEQRFSVQSNHTDMVKFNSPDDKAFQDIVTCLKYCDVQYDRTMVIETLVENIILSGRLSEQTPSSEQILLSGQLSEQTPSSEQILLSGPTVTSPTQTPFYVDLPKPSHRPDDERCDLKSTEGFLFLLHNLDYQNWISKTGEINTLVYKSFPCLPYAVPHLIRTIQSTEENSLLLNFSLSEEGQTTPIYTYTGKRSDDDAVIVMVCTFFYQIIKTFSKGQGEYLLQTFLHILLSHLRNSALKEIQKETQNKPYKDGFHNIIKRSESNTLWTALEEVLLKAADLYTHAGPNRKTAKPSLKIILDLSRVEIKWEKITESLRLVIQGLRWKFSTVKLLITNPPDGISIQLLPPSEVCISYGHERQECLGTLQFKNPRYNKIAGHQSNTLTWLWETSEYKSWISSEPPNSSLLFIEGKPGSGKSTLARYFAKNFTPPSESIVLKFFYNTRDGEFERDHRNMLGALLYQILDADESFFIHFQSIYRRGGGSMIEWCSEDMKNILRACKMHLRPCRIYLIIDAMDESASTDRLEIINFFHELSAPALNKGGCMVNIFLASRPINELQLDNWPGRQIIRLQDMNQRDIERYTHDLLQNNNFRYLDIEVKEEIAKYVLNLSDGVFIWVCLVLKELAEEVMNGSRKSTLISFLKSLPKSLESLYECMLQRLARNKGQAIADGKRILQFCLFSGCEIALIDLQHALAIPGLAEDKEPDYKSWVIEMPRDIRKMLTHCLGGFLEVKANTMSFPVVQVMHQTVREFFLHPRNPVQRSYLHVTEYNGLEMIQLTCVRFLEIVSEEVIGLKIQGPGSISAAQVRRHLEYLEKRPFIKFSLEYLKANLDVLAPGITDRLTNLVEKTESSTSPRSLMMVLFNGFLSPGAGHGFQRRLGVNVEDYIKRLLIEAAMMGYHIAIRNLLVLSGTDSVQNSRQETLLHLTARGGHYKATMFLIESGAYLEAKDIKNRTALHHAVLEEHEAVIRVLLTNNAKLDARDTTGQNALHLAAIKGLLASVRVLLINKADIQALNCEGSNALHLAAINGREPVVHFLLTQNADINIKNSENQTALHLAVINGHEGTAQLLLTHNADPQAKDCLDRAALHLAVKIEREDIVQLLLTHNAHTEARDSGNHTPLHLAVIKGYVGIARLLLIHNADPQANLSKSRAALHLAVVNNHEGVVRLLLTHNVDLEAWDWEHHTALHLAVLNGYKGIAQALLTHNADPQAKGFGGLTALHLAVINKSEDIVQLLLTHNADIEARDWDNQTVLYQAVINGDVSMAQLLLTHNADPQVKGSVGRAALHSAVVNKREEIVQLLLTHNAETEVRDWYNHTALHLAARDGHNAIAQLLLSRNADPQARDNNGSTAIHFAALNGHMAIVQLLIRHIDLQVEDDDGRTALNLAALNGHEAIVYLLSPLCEPIASTWSRNQVLG